MRAETDVSNLFEKFLSPEPILSPELDSQRSSCFVYDSLLAKLHPDARKYEHFDPTDQFQEDPQQHFTRLASPFVLMSIDKGDPSERVLLMDKLQPHAQYELMIMSGAPGILPGLADHNEGTRQTIFRIMSQFPSFAKKRNLYPYIAFNYDPDTFDRSGGQTEKRFHGHLLSRTQDEIHAIQDHRTQLDTISPLRQRRIIDETSVMGSLLLYDYLSSNKTMRSMKVMPPFSDANCSNLLFELEQSWDTLNSADFDADFQSLHASLQSLYQDVVTSISVGDNGLWQRPMLKDMTDVNQFTQVGEALLQLGWITPDNFQNIIYMLSRMKPRIGKSQMDFLRNPNAIDIANFILPVAGLCYSTAIYESYGKVYLSIRPYLFSDLGGAGIEHISQTGVKIKRGVGEYTPEEMHQRQIFQQEFTELISVLFAET